MPARIIATLARAGVRSVDFDEVALDRADFLGVEGVSEEVAEQPRDDLQVSGHLANGNNDIAQNNGAGAHQFQRPARVISATAALWIRSRVLATASALAGMGAVAAAVLGALD